ncbi:MAG: TdeIII family type II restriction endonuclease [Armatimonadetes bacterium]|nr:TdeIII family type II restriction endonuclease [Armatimonadota bacterium]
MNEREARMKSAIQTTIKQMMDRVMLRVLQQDPFLKDEHRAKRPLYAALVPDEIFKGSHFERRFVTPFGSVWEKLAVVAALEGAGYGELGRRIIGNVKRERLARIQQVLDQLEHPVEGQRRIPPDWNTELAYVLEGKGEPIPVTVVADVYVEDRLENKCYAFELKAPLPNSDITKVSKEKILKLYSMEPPQINEAYYSLPYNPFGLRENYSWSFPSRWFNMREDPVVLIGSEFWEKVGGPGTYTAFINAVNEIGPEYKERIYREFLGIVPPESDEEIVL